MAVAMVRINLELIDGPHLCTIGFDYRKGTPGKFDGHPDDCYDSEPDEIEIGTIVCNGAILTGLLEIPSIEEYIIECIKGRIDDE